MKEREADWTGALRQFAGADSPPQERCDLCGSAIAAEHEHLLEIQKKQLTCACTSCALLLCADRSSRFRRVPRAAARPADFDLGDADWEALRLPIALAFFVRRGADDAPVALYPGPAGATESTLDLSRWESDSGMKRVISSLQTDVEALLINRVDGARDCYRLPIDRCYRLVGLIRRHWHGFSGGSEVRAAITHFFEELRREAQSGDSADA